MSRGEAGMGHREPRPSSGAQILKHGHPGAMGARKGGERQVCGDLRSTWVNGGEAPWQWGWPGCD